MLIDSVVRILLLAVAALFFSAVLLAIATTSGHHIASTRFRTCWYYPGIQWRVWNLPSQWQRHFLWHNFFQIGFGMSPSIWSISHFKHAEKLGKISVSKFHSMPKTKPAEKEINLGPKELFGPPNFQWPKQTPFAMTKTQRGHLCRSSILLCLVLAGAPWKSMVMCDMQTLQILMCYHF